jgi:hypothetical protein
MSDKCPKCGAEEANDLMYKCHSMKAGKFASFLQSGSCRIRTLESRVAALQTVVQELWDEWCGSVDCHRCGRRAAILQRVEEVLKQ